MKLQKNTPSSWNPLWKTKDSSAQLFYAKNLIFILFEKKNQIIAISILTSKLW